MTTKELYDGLTKAKRAEEAVYVSSEWPHHLPLGGKDNNAGPVGLANGPWDGIIERATNGIDASIEKMVRLYGGSYPTPHSAVQAIPQLAAGDSVYVRILPNGSINTSGRYAGSHKRDKGIVEIRDFGIGIEPFRMKSTILEINGGHKIDKTYLMGQYGWGGSSSYHWAGATLVASRAEGHPVSFTLVREHRLGAKGISYRYLVLDDGTLPTIEIPESEFPVGTLIRHLDYELPSGFTAAAGEKSCYGLLQKFLFKPPMPIIYVNGFNGGLKIEKIRGSAFKLDSLSPDDLSYEQSLSFDWGKDGTLSMKYWLLSRAMTVPKTEAARHEKPETGNFVDPKHPIVLVNNGQVQKEFTMAHIARAGLTYLTKRLIVEIDVTQLSFDAKLRLLVPTRKDIKEGDIRDNIIAELESAIGEDPVLKRCNEEETEKMHKNSEALNESMKAELAAILKMDGKVIGKLGAGVATVPGLDSILKRKRKPRVIDDVDVDTDNENTVALPPVQLQDPPTFLKFAVNFDLKLYPGKKRRLTLVTDATDKYSEAIEVFLPAELRRISTSPLKNGEFQIEIEALDTTVIGTTGTISIELRPPKMRTLSASKVFTVVEPLRNGAKPLTMPEPNFMFLNQTERQWYDMDWPTDVTKIAFEMLPENESLAIYANEHLPAYRDNFDRFAKESAQLAENFKIRYRLYLTAYCLKANEFLTPYPDRQTSQEIDRGLNIQIAEMFAYCAAHEIEHELNGNLQSQMAEILTQTAA